MTSKVLQDVKPQGCASVVPGVKRAYQAVVQEALAKLNQMMDVRSTAEQHLDELEHAKEAVDAWFKERIYHAREDLQLVQSLKGKRQEEPKGRVV